MKSFVVFLILLFSLYLELRSGLKANIIGRKLHTYAIFVKKVVSPRFVVENIQVLPYHNNISQIEDDGYSRTKNRGIVPFFRGLVNRFSGPNQPGYLILVRHGESLWNENKTFTGWVDVDLCERGRREVEHAARLLL